MAHPTWVEGRANTGLNVNDFKLQLYSQLKSSGVLSTLKTQLRSQVLNKLQTEHGAAIAPAQQAQQNLWRRAMNSIVAEYLAASRYDYTLSVFQPECGLSSAAPFTHAEILQVLHIEEATPLHLALAKRGVHAKDPAGSPPQQCFALSLLEAVAELSSRRTAHESATQTSEGPGAARLGLQLTQLEDAYLTRADSERQKPFDTLEARMARYRQECDQRVKEEVAMQVERVRELELSAVRLEEADRHRKALEGEREALDRLHQAKLGKLREREELTTERLQRQQRDVENVAFEHRQRILREEDRLRAAKAEWEADMGALQERLRHREQHAESREKAVLLRENEAERRTAEALEAAASAHVTARKEVEKEYSVQRESIRRERVALETDRVRVLELKNDTAAELAEARLTRERLRAAEAARAEAESRAGVHAAAEECLMLQVQELRRALAEANEQLRHGGKLPSSVLRQLAGIENRGDRIRAVHDDSHQQPYGWQAEALRLEAVVRQLKRQAGQLAHDLAASQARENFWRGTAQAADRIVDEAVAGREGSLQAVEEARLALMASERDLQELRDQLDQAQQQRAGSQAGGVTSTAQASPARGMGFPFPMHGSLAHTEQGALVQSFGARSAGSHRLDEVLRAEERLKSEVVAFKRRVEAQRDASAHHMRRVMAGIVQLQDESATSDMTSFSSDNGTSFISDSRHATPARAPPSLSGADAAMREPGYETDVESVASVIKSLASEELNMPASSRAQDGVLEVLGVAPSQEASTHATPRTDPHPLDNSDAYLSDPESSLPAKLPSAEDGSIGSLSADDFFGRNGTGSDSEDSVF
ncbi:hypothetical protein WJX72_003703 [[Myrmecia] bisecta]|uniref:LisH domain-containing protein n=1 Tax=[Myrmecia] bisecta TaxID=41462 RepID=A0AAW1R5Z0_9CHLO